MAGISKLYGCPHAAQAVSAKRAELLESHGDVPLVLSEPLTPQNRQDLRVNESAAASLLIDFICEHLRQTVPPNFPFPEYKEDPKEWWECFGLLMLGHIGHEQLGLLTNIKKKALEEPTEPDEVDKAAFRYYAARKALYPERAQAYKDFPSASDLIHFGIPFIRLIEDLYEKTYENPIPDDHLLNVLTKGNLPDIMVQAQINVKSTEFPLADLLFGRISLQDLDDPTMILNSSLGKMPVAMDMAFMKMNPDFFEFEGHDSLHIAIKAEVIELYRAKTKRVFDALAGAMAEAGTPMVRMNCPILYTQQFRPLWEWFLQNFVRLRFGAEKAHELFPLSKF